MCQQLTERQDTGTEGHTHTYVLVAVERPMGLAGGRIVEDPMARVLGGERDGKKSQPRPGEGHGQSLKVTLPARTFLPGHHCWNWEGSIVGPKQEPRRVSSASREQF